MVCSTLGGFLEPHLCVKEQVVKSTIPVQIHRKCVGMIMVVVKGPSVFVFVGQFAPAANNPTPTYRPAPRQIGPEIGSGFPEPSSH